MSEAMLGFHITDCHGGPQSFKDALGIEVHKSAITLELNS